jgi:membrane protease subunit (stomatin/prohibitin family)
MDAKFGLIPFNMLEPNFKIPIPVTSRGSFALSIIDSRTFLNKIVGTVPDFETRTISQYFRGVIVESTKNAITKIANEQKLSPLELESIVLEVASAVKGLLANTISEFGLDLRLFNIEAIPIIDEDPRVKKIIEDYQKIHAENYARKTELEIIAQNLQAYSTQQSFGVSEKVAQHMGGGLGDGGNLMGTMIQMGMVNPIANTMANIMSTSSKPINETTPALSTVNTENKEEIFESLIKLGQLKSSGIITDQEFELKKKELLSRI